MCSIVASWTIPTILIVCYILIEVLEWFETRSVNISISFFVLSCFIFNMPACMMGSFKGFHTSKITVPVTISKMDRAIPNNGAPGYL
mmetsp:Transcript_10366/g.14282  ORF Transcript_10366/g.14282 Transcript_10366/m.14282 type:complete len:87 (+) Transcript_10366:1199-1459(+)